MLDVFVFQATNYKELFQICGQVGAGPFLPKGDQPMNQQEIEAGIRAMSLSSGDIVLLHSSLSSLGQVEGGADTVIDAFLTVLGPEGTLAVPNLGSSSLITETLANRPNAVCSIHPRASVAAIGAHAEEICRDHWQAETAHAEDTPYTRMAAMGGYACLLGVDQDRNTTLHSVETFLQLPYLNTTPEITFSTPQGQVTKSWPHFPGPHRNFIGLDKLLRDQGIVRVGKIGKAVVRLMKSRELIDTLLTSGALDPSFVLCDNPHCEACIRQRADVFRHRLQKEDGVIAASAVLAGRYLPQMVENLTAQGIEAVELDYIQGKPVQNMPQDRLVAAVAELVEAGCKVISLRASAITEQTSSLIDAAAVCQVPRVVLPLTEQATNLMALAAKQNVALSFYNTHLGSINVFEKLSVFREKGLDTHLTFSAANFAQAGEKPFLTSYNNKLKRFTDQLDIEDCTFDATYTCLGQGNAEIKELISILRCASFSGYMVLGAGNRATGDLGQTLRSFLDLLDRM
jgi:aminoglycoside 3-N-acetyltransferase